MTTITLRDGIMAADTMVADSTVVRGTTSKIVRTNGGHLLALCGSMAMTIPFAKWIERGQPQGDLPRLPPETRFAALVAYLDGPVAIFSEKMLAQFANAEFYSIGSGSEIALGAMAMGAGAVKAVEIACRFDPWSREPVQSKKL